MIESPLASPELWRLPLQERMAVFAELREQGPFHPVEFENPMTQSVERFYAVTRFEHQFAGVLVLQNAEISDKSAQCILHRCFWTPEIDPHLKQDTFHDFVRSAGIDSVEVRLNPGDLYFFNTRLIHEVPGVAGALPRVVLATFIGYSSDRREVFVWS